jgi:hypothetical protein
MAIGAPKLRHKMFLNFKTTQAIIKMPFSFKFLNV